MSLYESLKHYLDVTPMDDVLRAWNETAHFDEVDSPTLEEFDDFNSFSKIFEVAVAKPPEPHTVASFNYLEQTSPKISGLCIL